MLKILVLDFDGCMIPSLQPDPVQVVTQYGVYDAFDFNCVDALNEIHFQTKCKLVISSDWRINNIPRLSWMMEYLRANHVYAPLLGFTSNLRNKATLEELRELEIIQWVETHLPERWVAVDDYDLSGLSPNFVRCFDDQIGIAHPDVTSGIISILNAS